MKKTILLLALGAALTLQACANMSAVAPGPYKLKSGTQVTLDQAWTKFPKQWHSAKSDLLTQDGLTLNQLHLITVEDGESFLKDRRKSAEYPVYTRNMSPIKQVEFLTANLSRLGLENLKEKNVVPTQIGGYDGITLDLAGHYSSGLNLKGRVAMVETEEGLNLLIFIAPAEHYFDKDIASVNRMIDSFTFPASKA